MIIFMSAKMFLILLFYSSHVYEYRLPLTRTPVLQTGDLEMTLGRGLPLGVPSGYIFLPKMVLRDLEVPLGF